MYTLYYIHIYIYIYIHTYIHTYTYPPTQEIDKKFERTILIRTKLDKYSDSGDLSLSLSVYIHIYY